MSRVLSVAEVRQRMSWPAERDVEVARLIDEVTALAETLTDRLLPRVVDAIEEFDLEDGETRFRLRRYPVEAIAIVAWNRGDEEPDNFDDPLTADEDYRLSERSGGVLLTQTFDRVRCKITGGYTDATLPADLRQAMIDQILYNHSVNAPERVGVSAVAMNNISAGVRSDPILPKLKVLTSMYRRQTF